MSKRITPSDEGYDSIHDAWVENGRAAQFDMQGDFGGAIYKVLDTKAENPDFYRAASMHPTTVDEFGNVTNEGWLMANKEHFSLETSTDRHGRITVTPPSVPLEW